MVETIHHCWGWLRQGLVAYYRLPMLQVIRFSKPGLARAVAITSCILMATNISAAPARTPNAVAQIRSILLAQQDAWNRGDIDGFMNGYARSASTVFISEDSVRRGWETVRARYRQKYSDRAKMGTLSFSDLEINLLSSDAAVVLGRWRLERAKDRPHGRFTLIFRRLPEGWRIVHDHTSAAPP
ncbi:MAG: nuclear transport factor 2 family protein [Candidatus Udaeobacter sp.]